MKEVFVSQEYEPVSETIFKLTRHVGFVEQVLKEALEPVKTKLTEAKTNRAQNDALAKEYQAGMEKISIYVQVVLELLRAPSKSQQHKGVMELLSLFLYSLAEIERCMHRGAVYTSSGAISKAEGTTFLDVDNNCRLSRACRLLFGDFSFCLDLVQIAFNRFIFKILDISENPVGQEINKDIAEEFCRCRPFNLFEWSERSLRPILKQHFVQLGQQVLQHHFASKVVKGAIHEDVKNLCEELKEVKIDPERLSPQIMQILEEPHADPSCSQPPKVNFKDVEILKHVARGASGNVYQCKWQDKDMIVKKIPLDHGEPKFQEKFELEVLILSSLKHPNAVKIFGFGFTKEDGYFYGFILLEQMDMDLKKTIEDIKKDERSLVFPIDVSIDLSLQIVEALCAMKCEMVMHRDLKPANILCESA